MQINTTTDLLNAAAAALARRDGHAFERLHSINDGWMQTDTERAATAALLNVMQEAAYQLEDEPSQFDDGTEWDADAA
jgi:hypothetical protein